MDLTERISDCRTPFELRNILNCHMFDLKIVDNTKAFYKKLKGLTNNYTFTGEGFLLEVTKNLSDDFKAEVIYGVHRDPPPVPVPSKWKEVDLGEIDFVSSIKLTIPGTETNIMKQLEVLMIQEVLNQCDWNRQRTAERLGMSIRTLRNKLQEFDKRNILKRKTKRVRRKISPPIDKVDDWVIDSKETPKGMSDKIDAEKKEPRQIAPDRSKIIEKCASLSLGGPVMAYCCPTKLEWSEGSGLCLACWKKQKKEAKAK